VLLYDRASASTVEPVSASFGCVAPPSRFRSCGAPLSTRVRSLAHAGSRATSLIVVLGDVEHGRTYSYHEV